MPIDTIYTYVFQNLLGPFRTITGICNNWANPYWGAANTPLSREIIVGEYDPKTTISTKKENQGNERANAVISGKYFLARAAS